jgi:hypothetical protein
MQISLTVKQKYAPYTLVEVKGKLMELISYPFYADYANPSSDIRIKVRKPNNSASMIEVSLRDVSVVENKVVT